MLRSALVLGIPWTVWHVPALFYLPTLMALGIFLPGFALGRESARERITA